MNPAPGQENRGWQSCLPDNLRIVAENTARQVPAELLRISEEPSDTASLAEGAAGLSVAHHYFANAWPGEGHEAAKQRYCDARQAILEAQPMSLSLFAGFTGIAWAFLHLGCELEIVEEIDDALVDYLSSGQKQVENDVISGEIGIVIYALEQGRHDRRSERLIELAVGRLIGALDTGELLWKRAFSSSLPAERARFPTGYLDPGGAHGAAGVLGVLTRVDCRNADEGDREIRVPRRQLASRPPAAPGLASRFPSMIVPNGELLVSRSAWCYGDVGIASVLLRAARAISAPEREVAAREAASLPATRNQETASVMGAGLCHGAAGLAHQFNRLYQSLRDPVPKDATVYWALKAVAMRWPGEAIAGYPRWYPPTWRADKGILTGAAGVALCLLAEGNGKAPRWDRFLLLSTPEE